MATPAMEGDRLAPNPSAGKLAAVLIGALRRAWLPLLLFSVSVLTTAGSGARFVHDFRFGLRPLASESDFLPLAWIWHHPNELWSGWSFSLALLGILLAHEAGHLIACRKHGIRASWPYVLPAPTLSGTAGAVIRIGSRIPSRRALIEVGVAGPLAGYLVAVPVCILGLLRSVPVPAGSPPALLQFHQPWTIVLLDRLLAPAAAVPSLENLLPHPLLLAGWIGFFITSLNLIPAGQLDGGHILYAISPRWHRVATFAVPALLLGMGLALWTGWLLWGAILLLPVMRHPRVPEFPLLPATHSWLGWIALALLALTFVPAPFAGTGLIELLR
ncbi:MAG TPA: site-2 protease family protein [Acidobacteriaceae bacterium]|nr:site-2 protease family protein [Acidobacteriaceae bacterium]